MINDHSPSKVFYEDLYKAFIFYVEHPHKVFMYKLFMRNIIMQTLQYLMYVCKQFVNIKSYEFNLTLKGYLPYKTIFCHKAAFDV